MYLAIDVGGTKTLLGVFNEKGELKEKVRFETAQDYEDFKRNLADSVARLTTKDFQACAVAIPGKVNREQGVGMAFGNLPWKKVPVQTDCELLVNCPVVVENDAKVAGLAEAYAVSDFKKVLYVTVGTGIGIAVTTNGIIDTAIGDGGGKDLILEHRGKHMAWESFASGKAIVRRYHKEAKDINDSSVWKMISRDFAVGLVALNALIEPDVIVIGGGVGSHFDRFGHFLTDELKKYATPLTPIPPLRPASHPEEAVLFGCYYLAKEKYGKAD